MYDYATVEYTENRVLNAFRYVDTKISETLTNNPDLLDLIERISDVLAVNDGAVVDFLYAIDNLRNEFDVKLTNKVGYDDLSLIYSEIEDINKRISEIEYGNESDGLTQYELWQLLSKPGIEQINTERIPTIE